MQLIESLRSRGDSAASQEEVVELTNQFYVTLRAYFANVKQSGAPRNQEAFNRIEQLLDTPRKNWTDAYEIEQLLVHLFDDDTVATELYLRSLEAQNVLRKELAAAYAERIKALDKADTAQRRTLLARLVNDLQWRYIVNEATRRYTKAITRRTGYLSVAALVVFLGIVGVIYYYSNGINVLFTRDDLRLLFVAGFAGLWGATFSMLATLNDRLGQTNLDQLKLMRALPILLSRALVGAGAASILFFFLLSGLLGGSAFPALGPAADGTAALLAKDLALLIVWCFIAGFSERLIPDLLNSTEKKATAGASDRVPPTKGSVEVPASGTPKTPSTDTLAGKLESLGPEDRSKLAGV